MTQSNSYGKRGGKTRRKEEKEDERERDGGEPRMKNYR